MDLLESVSQPSTIWSVVYNANESRIGIAMGRKYDELHDYELQQK